MERQLVFSIQTIVPGRGSGKWLAHERNREKASAWLEHGNKKQCGRTRGAGGYSTMWAKPRGLDFTLRAGRCLYELLRRGVR